MSSEPTKQRPGDQQLPAKNDLQFIQDAVIADIEARKQVGIERYGAPLQAFNGRSSLLDAYEESLDLSMYFKQMQIEVDEILASTIATEHGRTFPDRPSFRRCLSLLATMSGAKKWEFLRLDRPTCPQCGRELHGYRGPLCRWCDPEASTE